MTKLENFRTVTNPHVPPLAAVLPPDVQAKSQALADLADEESDRLSKANTKIRDLRDERQRLEQELERMRRLHVIDGNREDDFVADLAKMQKQITDLEAKRPPLSEQANTARVITNKAERYIRQCANEAMNAARDLFRAQWKEDYKPSRSAFEGFLESRPDLHLKTAPPVQITKKTAPADQLDAIRQAIRETDAKLHEIASAPVALDEVKAIVRSQVDRRITQPDFYSLREGGKLIAWPTHVLELQSGYAPDGIGLLLWLFKDQVVAKIEAELDAMAEPAEELTAADRKRKIAEAKAEKLELERREEALVILTGSDRRADADPRAVLGLIGPEPKE